MRWLILRDSGGNGLFVGGLPLLEFNALHYTSADMDTSKHSFELTRQPEVVLHLDCAHMGVGGDDSWGARPHEEFRVAPGPYTIRYRLRPLGPGDPDPDREPGISFLSVPPIGFPR